MSTSDRPGSLPQSLVDGDMFEMKFKVQKASPWFSETVRVEGLCIAISKFPLQSGSMFVEIWDKPFEAPRYFVWVTDINKIR